MKKSIIYIDALSVVDQAEVQNDTFFSIDTILQNGFIDFKFGTEAVSLTKGFESFFSELFTPGGNMKYQGVVAARMAQLAVTMGLFTSAANALMLGVHPDDVSITLSVNKSGTLGLPDVTDAEAAVAPGTVVLQEFTLLARAPLPQITGKDLYIYFPKCSVVGNNQQFNLRLNEQVKPAITFEGLALDDTELAKHQDIFSGVSQGDVAYIFIA